MFTKGKIMRIFSSITSIAIVIIGIFFITNNTRANSIVVNSTADVIADDGVCTLREAIENANDTVTGDPHGFVSPGECGAGDPLGLDTITFSPAAFPGTITLTSSLPDIVTPIVIDGVSGIPGLSCGDLPGGVQHVLGVEIDATSSGNGFQILGSTATGTNIKGMAIYTSGAGLLNGSGILISSTDLVSVTCSYIGTDKTGITNNAFGQAITVSNSNNIIIGGDSLGNVLLGKTGIDSNSMTNSKISGNIIGLDAVGLNQVVLADTTPSIGISLNGNTSDIDIGGDTVLERNIISGFQAVAPVPIGYGILLYPSSSISNIRIQGNYIGTDITGMVAIPNHQGILGAVNGGNLISNIQIGGSNIGEGNLISGQEKLLNPFDSRAISFQAQTGSPLGSITGITILGNYIGTEKTGTSRINATAVDDVIFDSALSILGISNITVGGVGANERNIFGGNVQFLGVDTVTMKNNYVGVGQNGTDVIINGAPDESGVNFLNTKDFTMGGSTPIEGNIVAHKTRQGIGLAGGSTGIISNNIIKNNGIGISAIELHGGLPAYLLGTPQFVITNNSIFNNTGLGIDLVHDINSDFNFTNDPLNSIGPNLNDISDSDIGPNNNLNYPVIHSITESPLGTLNLNYYLDAPVGSYRVEFFKNPTAGLDSSYHGEGEEFVFADTFTSTGAIGSKSISFPGSLTDVITPTATECTDGTCTAFVRTSEFGPTVPITAGGGSGAGLDFGDVTTNQTTALNNGAYHILNTNYLGSCIDADTGTVENATATSDDTTAPTDPSAVVGVCATANDDEDGTTFDKATYTIGDSAVLTVTANAPGIVNVWVDVNNNGSFLDVGEQVLSNQPIVAGPNTLTGFTVPGTNGTYPIRVRYVSDISKIYQETPGVASPKGEALDGEVEDYTLQVGAVVVPPPPSPPSGGGVVLVTGQNIVTTSQPQTNVPQEQTSQVCPYFTKYLKLGSKDNDPVEVAKWQKFLNEHMGEKLTIGTVYDTPTYAAVKRFQKKYESDVLVPWGLRISTGWTYKTTRMKANKILNCPEQKVFLEYPKTWWELR